MPIKQNRAFISILCLNVLVYIVSLFVPNVMYALALKATSFSGGLGLLGLVEFITHLFAHDGFFHLFGNMFFVAPFAIYLERKIGSEKFIAAWLITGLGSALFFMCVPSIGGWVGLLGASGACSGILACALLEVDEHPVLRAAAIVALIVTFWMQFVPGLFDCIAPSGVAHMAHVGGMLTGLLLNAITKKPSQPIVAIKKALKRA